jgi:7-cyano-7-deazaguanine synthase
LAEVKNAQAIVIGVNAVDYSGYPDCRPEYIEAFTAMANLATKSGVEGHPITIETPLLHLSKANIIRLGIEHGLDYAQTVSCYQADTDGRACGKCDSCRLRHQGFIEAEVADPTRYVT